jgi:hypothetical protein
VLTDWIYSFADRDILIRHHGLGGGIGNLQDFCSAVDHEQNDMLEKDSESGAVEDDTRPKGESNVAVESHSDLETDYDVGSGSERCDSDDFSEDDGYGTP